MAASLLDTIKRVILVPPHPAGIPFIGGGVIAAAIFFAFSEVLGILALVFALFCVFFFRDPNRVTPQKNSLIVAGGDGLVSGVTENVSLPPEFASIDIGEYTRVSTFLSVLDVHVNRIPATGKIIKKVYSPGKFINADLDKASEDNERCSLLIEMPTGQKICIVQIAGLVARRIINDAREDQDVRAGARFGIIRFGSRIDIYLPQGTAPLVCVGQRSIGGETVIADLYSEEPARIGAII